MRLKALDLALGEKHYVGTGILLGLLTGIALKLGNYLLSWALALLS